MSLRGLVDLIRADPPLADSLQASVLDDVELVGPSPYYPFVLGALATATPRSVLAVTATTRESEDLVSALSSLVESARSRPFSFLGDAAA